MKPLCDATRTLLRPLYSEIKGELELSTDKVGQWTIVAHGETIGTHRYPPRGDLLGRLRSIPGATVHANDPYAVTVAQGFVALAMVQAILSTTKVQLKFSDSEVAASWQVVELHAALADLCAERVARWKLTKELPADCSNLEEHPDRPLMNHQRVCVKNNLDLPGYGNFLKMGTGKTPVAIITAMNMIKQRQAMGNFAPLRMLVVCPNAVRQNWYEEFGSFATRMGKVSICRGDEVQRITRLAQGLNTGDIPGLQFTAIIIGVDTLPRMEGFLSKMEWDLMVVDEAHTFVNGRTARCQAIQSVAAMAYKRLPLTGSPIRNNPLDLYELFEFISPGLSGFTSRRAWNAYYGVYTRTEQGFMKLEDMANIPMMKENLARCAMIVTKEEVLDLPAKTYQVEEVELTEKQKEVYKKVLDELALEIEGSLAGATGASKSLIIQNILVQMLRLSQVTGGFINWPDIVDPETGALIQKGHTEYFPTSPKIQRLLELILDEERGENDKCIVWCHHRAELAWVSAALAANGVKHVCYHGDVSEAARLEAVRLYNNDPTVRVFLATQGSGGTGLNLLGFNPKAEVPQPTNTTDEYFLSQGWSSIVREQAEDRGHRNGGRVPVRITTIVVPGSIDVQIERRLRMKKDVSSETQDVRELLSTLLGDLPE